VSPENCIKGKGNMESFKIPGLAKVWNKSIGDRFIRDRGEGNCERGEKSRRRAEERITKEMEAGVRLSCAPLV